MRFDSQIQQSDPITKGAGVSFQGRQILKKGAFFVQKALPTKVNFSNHVVI